MSDEYNSTASMEDLLAEEEEIFSNEPVSIKTGVAGNSEEFRPKADTVRENARRWLFNPFEMIDLRNEPTSCGISYLDNVVFNRIESIDVKVGKTDAYDLPGSKHNPDNYDNFKRTSLMITNELCGKNGDKGVVEILGLLGEDEADTASLNILLFGDKVECAFDAENPDHPCPVLPSLLESLDANVQSAVKDMDAETRSVVIATAKQVREAISLAMRNARTRIDEAQKRLLDESNPNRNLSIAEKRCYLALGQEIPNMMPFLTPRAASGFNQPQNAQQIDYEALGRGVAAGMQGHAAVAGTATPARAGAATGVATAPAPVTEPPATGFEVGEADLGETENVKMCAAANGKGEPCKNKAEEGSDFCRVPAHSQ